MVAAAAPLGRDDACFSIICRCSGTPQEQSGSILKGSGRVIQLSAKGKESQCNDPSNQSSMAQ